MKPYFEMTPEQDHRTVECRSQERLPYVPTGWQRTQKTELAQELLGLVESNPGESLSASYLAPSTGRHFDAENILFYNIGVKAFSKLARYGLEFETSDSSPANDIPEMPHCHRYVLRRGKKTGFQYWKRSGDPIRLTAVCKSDLRHDIKVSTIWYAMKTSGSIIGPKRVLSENSKYALTVTLRCGCDFSNRGNSHLNLAGIIKPVFDGIISSFHKYNGADLKEVSKRLAEGYLPPAKPDDIAGFLNSDALKLLEDRAVLHKRGKGVQWNPQDDNCVAGAIYLEIDEQRSTGFELVIKMEEVQPLISSQIGSR